MLTIFNRRELAVTADMGRQADIRNILSANGIDYTIKTTDLRNGGAFGSRRSMFGSFGINHTFTYEYKFYVHKDSYELAKHLIGQ